MTGIDLASCADFSLGDVTVRPSLCELVGAAGGETVEPRVMQVLVALAEARGRVVSRNDLVSRCWNGRVVSEDAIHRVISRIRRLARGPASTGFRLETVSKVGYRLIEVGDVTPPPAAASAERRRHVSLRTVGAGALLTIAALVAAFAVREAEASRSTRSGGVSGPPRSSASAALAAAQDLETRGIAAVFEGTPEQTAQGLAYLREATARSPGYASGWGSLSMAYVLSLAQTPAADQPLVALHVSEAAEQALRIDPHEGHALAALASSEPTFRNWRHKDEVLRRAMVIAPSDAIPLLFQRVQFLAYVGRTREALEMNERLASEEPLIPWIQAARIDLLVANHRLDEAQRVAAHAGQVWPRDRLIWFSRFFLDAFNGRPGAALAMAADQADWPTQTSPGEIALARQVAGAIVSRSPSDLHRVLSAYKTLAPQGQSYAEIAIRVAAALGRPKEALQFAENLYLRPAPPGPRGLLIPRIGYALPGERVTSALFIPPTDALWSRPEFLKLVTEIGLTSYWRSTVPPDLCDDVPVARQCEQWGLIASRSRSGGLRG